MDSTFAGLPAMAARHAGWLPLAAFVSAFLQSLPFVGLFVPGTALFLAIGAATALAGAPIWSILACAIVGGALGGWLSYIVGRRSRGLIEDGSCLRARPRLLTICETLFHDYGVASVLVAKFLPVARPMLPMFVGAFGLQPRRFHPVNILAAMLWAPSFILPGAIIGSMTQGAEARTLAVLVGLLIASLWGLYLLAVGALRLVSWLEAWRRARFKSLDGRSDWWLGSARLVLDPGRASTRQNLLGGLLLVLGAFYIFNLGEDLISRGPIIRADGAVANLIAGIASPRLDTFMIIISALGDWPLITGITILVAARLAFQGHRRPALLVAAAGLATAVLVPALKGLFQLARPTPLYSGVDAYSFPSGHTASSAALYLVLAWLCARPLSGWRRLMPWGLAIGAIGLTALSRIYLGAHWPSDVVAGLALGATLAIAGILWVASGSRPDAARMAPHSGGPVLISIAVVWLFLAPGALRQAWTLYRPGFDRRGAVEMPNHAPPRRIDLLGNEEEAFTAAWTGDLRKLRYQLLARGWTEAPRWTAAAGFFLMASDAPMSSLPPPRTLHDGRFAEFTMIAPGATSRQRQVLRLWRSGSVVMPDGAPAVGYVGSLTSETTRDFARIATFIEAPDDDELGNGTLMPITPLRH